MKRWKSTLQINEQCSYSKTVENLRNRVDVGLVNNKKDYLKWISTPCYLRQKIFDNNLVVIHKIKTTLTLKKPANIRICVLELSKVPMYEFHFDYIKNKYGSKSRLSFTDPDSFMYEIQIENVYGDFSKNKEMFDFSNYSAKSKYYDD